MTNSNRQTFGQGFSQNKNQKSLPGKSYSFSNEKKKFLNNVIKIKSFAVRPIINYGLWVRN